MLTTPFSSLSRLNRMTLLLVSGLLAVMGLAFLALHAPASRAATVQPQSDNPVVTAAQLRTVEQSAQGFDFGNRLNPNVVYIFFDPKCPHCRHLWDHVQPLAARAHYIWVPVALLGPDSTTQAEAILGATDPVAAMDANERDHAVGGENAPGLVPTAAQTARWAPVVARNTALLASLGVRGVPFMVRQDHGGHILTVLGDPQQNYLDLFLPAP